MYPKTIFMDLKTNNAIDSNKIIVRKINHGFESYKPMCEYKKIKKIFTKLSWSRCDLVILISFLSNNLLEELFIRYSVKNKVYRKN